MKIVAVITVKNEGKLLRQNILYHRFIGVNNFFIFFDETTDDSLHTIEDLPFVYTTPSVSPKEFENQPGFERMVRKAPHHHTARQCLNTAFAIEKAQKANADWIISLDADELVCLDFTHSKKGQLVEFFATIDENVQQVRFQALEVVQRGIEYENVFAQETLFKMNSPRIRRRIYDPFYRKKRTLRGFYGHHQGKSALNLNTPAIPKTVHSFTGTDGHDLLTIWKKYILHYNCYCFSEFIKKFENFKNRPDTYLHGEAVEYLPKRLWRDMVNSSVFTRDDLEKYFKKYIMFTEKAIRRLRRAHHYGRFKRQPVIFEIDSVKKAFMQIKGLDRKVKEACR